MKVLYAIQGTGNGHLSRAKEIIPALKNRVDLDVLVSGIQADLDLPFAVKYRYHGLSFIFGKHGGVNVFQTIRKNSVSKLLNEIKTCPVENYDLIINDFEPISAWACKAKGLPCVSLSHQSALKSKAVPKAKHQDVLGAFVLKNYAPCSKRFSFHFEAYDENIFKPVIRKEIRDLKPTNGNHYTVYLPAYGDEQLISVLGQVKNVKWSVFSKHTKKAFHSGNVHVEPVSASRFTESMASAKGVLCGAGFETPAEALFLKKKLLVIPMKRQCEQHYNAAALEKMGATVIPKLDAKYLNILNNWMEQPQNIKVDFPDDTQEIVDMILLSFIKSVDVDITEYLPA